MFGYLTNHLLRRSSSYLYNPLRTFCSVKSKFSNIDVDNINMSSLSSMMIESLNEKTEEDLKQHFQKNLNLAQKLQGHSSIDQEMLCQQLLNYNDYIYKTYLQKFFRVRMWNKKAYDFHFSSIQIIAANILHDHFLQNSQNKELISQVTPDLLKSDIYKQFGVINYYEEIKTQMMERYEIVSQFNKQYEGKVLLLDYTKYAKVHYYKQHSIHLTIRPSSPLYIPVIWTGAVLVGMAFVLESLEMLVLVLCLLVVMFFFFYEVYREAGHPAVEICSSCRFQRVFLNETRREKFQFCEECSEKIKQSSLKQKPVGLVKKIWNKLSFGN